MDEPRATIDFETRSQAELKHVGGVLYSQHPSTEVLCLAYKLPGDKDVRLWMPKFGIGDLDPLFGWIELGGLVEAHNSAFERNIWENVCWDWPQIEPRQWRCSAAKAAACAIPRDLERACEVMGVEQLKDPEGKRLINMLCKPGRKGVFHEDDDALRRLGEYCRQDVRAEEALSDALPDLSDYEQEVWFLDQDINLRGALIDTTFVRKAIQHVEQAKMRLNSELEQISGIESGTKRKEVLAWLCGRRVPVLRTAADELRWALSMDNIDPDARRVMEIVLSVNKTSTAKYPQMLKRVDDGGRAKELLMYHGAATGRWTGKGIQPQNFPRGKIGKRMDFAAQEVIELRPCPDTLDYFEMMYDDPMEHLSGLLRGSIIPKSGHYLGIADFSSIEARVLAWIAGEDYLLDLFRADEDVYCEMATIIYGREITPKDESERQLGKIAVLGLGYGMGFVTFLITLRTMGQLWLSNDQCRAALRGRYQQYIDIVKEMFDPQPDPYNPDPKKLGQRRVLAAKWMKTLEKNNEVFEEVLPELAVTKMVVDKYRRRNQAIKALWTAMYEAASSAALEGEHFAGGVRWVKEGKFLCGYLPSGRPMRYFGPEIRMAKTAWGEKKRSLHYWCMELGKWQQSYTYGGKLVENACQAIARDLMVHSMFCAEETPYKTVLTVHDELVSEVPEAVGDAGEYGRIMAQIPDWAQGCPVGADAKMLRRYRKG